MSIIKIEIVMGVCTQELDIGCRGKFLEEITFKLRAESGVGIRRVAKDVKCEDMGWNNK